MSKFVGGLSTSAIFDRCVYLINLLFYFQIAIWMVEVFHQKLDFSGLAINVVLCLIVLRTYLRSLKWLQYSFWTFSALVFLYLFNAFTNYLFNFEWMLATCYLVQLCLISVVLFQMSSPLFYPRVRWWEADFRFKGDLKVWLKTEGQDESPAIEARLTDLRRRAGCLVLFPDLELGREYTMEIFDPPFPTQVKIKMMSKRLVAPGRGQTYGIKFIAKDPVEKKVFKQLKSFWYNFKEARVEKKFQTTSAFDAEAAEKRKIS